MEKNKDNKDKQSEAKTRAKIQLLLQNNMRTPIGMFHAKELNERNFVNALFKNFDITPKQS